MKTFELRFEPVLVAGAHGPEVYEAAKSVEIYGEKMSIETTGGADYVQIRDDKNLLVFSCNAAQLTYCRLLSSGPKLSVASTEGGNRD